MGRSTVCSSIVVVVLGLLSLAPPTLASLPGGEPRASSLRIFGAYLPDRLEWDDARWGYGLAARTSLSRRWGIDVGIARFTSSDRALTPVTVGFAYGPETRSGVRPWVEFGAGLYRLESTISPFVVAPTIPYHIPRVGLRETRRNNAGGYVGVGLDVPLSSRVGLGTGVRMHGWSYPDGMIAAQTGLSFAF
ncbi:MAG TPA: hypothetical protein VJW75_03895 [Candidatus Eisenbacteria bacterium]|nr:hypothetical protein [Candidatus Eisenbacteria bacterium]